MTEIVAVWFDESWGFGMTKEEMQVLRALETGLECAEELLTNAESDFMSKLRPRGVQIARAEVRQIEAAIEVVKRWETEE